MKYIFWVGILMICYDMMGHLCCLVARITEPTGAKIWNTYSRFIWPSLANSKTYDAYWSLFFLISLTFLIIGYRHK